MFHPADWVRKLPAVVWGVGSIMWTAILLRRRAGVAAGLLAAVLLAAAPFHVRYSQELRPYSLGLFCLTATLVCLDEVLRRPRWQSVLLLYLGALATAYALYFAAVALAVAGGALLVGEALGPEPQRRRVAQRALLASPLFGLALFVGYLPWFPVVLEAARRPSPTAAPALSVTRLGQSLSFFAFASGEGQPLNTLGWVYAAIALCGCIVVSRQWRIRFLIIWLVGTAAVVELVAQRHPHYYSARHYLTAGFTVPLLVALALAHLPRYSGRRIGAIVVTLCIVGADLSALALYYKRGRQDYRQLAKYLRKRPRTERIFTENQYTALCVAYYVVGPTYLYRRGHTMPEVVSLEGKVLPIAWNWAPGTTAWLVVGGGGEPSPELRQWSSLFPGLSFPRAEGVTLRRLDPALWQEMTRTIPGGEPQP